MMPRPAQYLLRFDDLCPTMDRARWQRFLPIIERFGIEPILAIVPENCDPALKLSAPDPAFWASMRAQQEAGAAIGLHGFRHTCSSRGRNLVPLHATSEFAGVPQETQRQWIRKGIEILRSHGLSPRIWVAPRHGFDANTLAVLCAEEIALLSDGFARMPFARRGATWFPQQLWAAEQKREGLWTICLHSNTAPDSVVRQLEEFLSHHAGQFTSVDRVLKELPLAPLSVVERLREAGELARFQTRHYANSLFRRK